MGVIVFFMVVALIVLIIITIYGVSLAVKDDNNKAREEYAQKMLLQSAEEKMTEYIRECYYKKQNNYHHVLDMNTSEGEYRKDGSTIEETTGIIGLTTPDCSWSNRQFSVWKNDSNLCFAEIQDSYEVFEKTVKDQLQWLVRYGTKEKGVTQEAMQLRKAEVEDRMRAYVEEYRDHPTMFFIRLDGIEYYNYGGNKYTSTSVMGGGGTVGGSSIVGGVVGGAIAGEAGAIIGSRKETKIDPVRSFTMTHDETKTRLKYRNDKDVLCEIESQTESLFVVLKKVIPELEYDYIMSRNVNIESTQAKDDSSKTESAADEIRKFRKLCDDGVITEEEFEAKKKQLLGL